MLLTKDKWKTNWHSDFDEYSAQGGKPEYAKIVLPEFTMSSDMNVLDVTKELHGVKHTPLHITEDKRPMYLSECTHTAFVKFDTHGAKAGAATTVSASRGLSLRKTHRSPPTPTSHLTPVTPSSSSCPSPRIA
eukprot:3814057-Rhodomonas_salina.2